MQKRQADMEEAYSAQVRPSRVINKSRLGTPERHVLTIYPLPPPSTVGRRQRLASPRLRPARERPRGCESQP